MPSVNRPRNPAHYSHSRTETKQRSILIHISLMNHSMARGNKNHALAGKVTPGSDTHHFSSHFISQNKSWPCLTTKLRQCNPTTCQYWDEKILMTNTATIRIDNSHSSTKQRLPWPWFFFAPAELGLVQGRRDHGDKELAEIQIRLTQKWQLNKKRKEVKWLLTPTCFLWMTYVFMTN